MLPRNGVADTTLFRGDWARKCCKRHQSWVLARMGARAQTPHRISHLPPQGDAKSIADDQWATAKKKRVASLHTHTRTQRPTGYLSLSVGMSVLLSVCLSLALTIPNTHISFDKLSAAAISVLLAKPGGGKTKLQACPHVGPTMV